MNALQIGWMVFILIHVALWVPFGLLFYTRCHYHPLKNLRPKVLLLANLGGIGFSIVVLLVPFVEWQVSGFSILDVGGTSLGVMFDSYVVITSSLYFAFSKTMLQSEVGSLSLSRHSSSLALGVNSIRKYSFFLSDRCAYIYVGLNAVCYNAIIWAYALLRYSDSFPLSFNIVYKQRMFVELNMITTAKLFMANLLYCAIAFRIRMIKDEIGIKRLLKRTAIAGAICFVTFWLVLLIETLLGTQIQLEMVAAVLGVDAVFILSIVIPVRRSYKDRRSSSTSVFPSECLLDGFLRTSRGFEAFKKHLEKEFAVENILFWRDADDFMTAFATSPDNAQKALRIYTMYIAKNAPFSVNLDSQNLAYYNNLFSEYHSGNCRRTARFTRSSIWFLAKRSVLPDSVHDVSVLVGDRPNKEFGFVQADLFERASKQLLKLMESDSLPRFYRNEDNSRIWQDYIAGLKEQVVHDLVTDGSDEHLRILLK